MIVCAAFRRGGMPFWSRSSRCASPHAEDAGCTTWSVDDRRGKRQRQQRVDAPLAALTSSVASLVIELNIVVVNPCHCDWLNSARWKQPPGCMWSASQLSTVAADELASCARACVVVSAQGNNVNSPSQAVRLLGDALALDPRDDVARSMFELAQLQAGVCGGSMGTWWRAQWSWLVRGGMICGRGVAS